MRQPCLQNLHMKKQRANNQNKESCMFIQHIDKAVENKTFRFSLTKQICLFRNCHDIKLRTSHLS